MPRVTSADGTTIGFDRAGDGGADRTVVLVHGAFTDKSHPTLASVAGALAPWFTVVNYDRRGRGASGDTRPYAVEREVEDLAAVIDATGTADRAMVFGGSSGAALALEAAARLPDMITALALWEPPYHVDGSAPRLPDDFGAQLEALVDAGRPGDAVERFLVDAAGVPAADATGMRSEATWTGMEDVARTLAYEAYVMGPDNRVPAERLAAVAQPTLVITGDRSPTWMAAAGAAVAAALPHATHRVLGGQSHGVAPDALAPELLEWFTSAT